MLHIRSKHLRHHRPRTRNVRAVDVCLEAFVPVVKWFPASSEGLCVRLMRCVRGAARRGVGG
jgi:hypothetical protein